MAKLSDVAAINPTRKVKKGEFVPFVEMAALPLSGRDISPSAVETRIAKASGAHFQNGDTLLARITPCLENGKTAQVSGLPDGTVGEGSTEFELIDLKSFGVPLLEWEKVPGGAKKQYPYDSVLAWSAAVDACDGFVLVTPEYNHSVPGGLKNATDWLYPEWQGKAPVIAASGDDEFIAEHQALLPATRFIQVKQAQGAHSGVSLSPEAACAAIRAGVAQAVAQAPGAAPLTMAGPIVVDLQTQTVALADLFCQWPTLERLAGDALRFNAPDTESAVRMLNGLSAMSSMLR